VKIPLRELPLIRNTPLLSSELEQGYPEQAAFISCGVNVFALKTTQL
jgi:hypothetical protein